MEFFSFPQRFTVSIFLYRRFLFPVIFFPIYFPFYFWYCSFAFHKCDSDMDFANVTEWKSIFCAYLISLYDINFRYKSWKRRWFILNDNCLYYFEYTTDKEPRGIIPLENILVSTKTINFYWNAFSIHPFSLHASISIINLSE